LLVAKPPKVTEEMSEKHKFLLSNGWRVSFSMYEKEKLKHLDLDSGCRRQVVRFLKGWSKCDPSLHDITSYYWKNALFHLMDHEKELGWKPKDFSKRFFELIWLMLKFVEYRRLPVYFNPQMNLFKYMTFAQSERIVKRLYSLYTTENKFDKVFNFVTKDAMDTKVCVLGENGLRAEVIQEQYVDIMESFNFQDIMEIMSHNLSDSVSTADATNY